MIATRSEVCIFEVCMKGIFCLAAERFLDCRARSDGLAPRTADANPVTLVRDTWSRMLDDVRRYLEGFVWDCIFFFPCLLFLILLARLFSFLFFSACGFLPFSFCRFFPPKQNVWWCPGGPKPVNWIDQPRALCGKPKIAFSVALSVANHQSFFF